MTRRGAIACVAAGGLVLAFGVWGVLAHRAAVRATRVVARAQEYLSLGIDAPGTADFVPLPPGAPHNGGAAAIGAHLFNDRRLVKSGRRTCGACHLLNAGGTDGRVHGRLLTQPAQDLAFEARFMHDGRFTQLKDAVTYMVTDPDYGHGPSNAVARLAPDAALVRRFASIYETGLVQSNVVDSIVQFLRSRTSAGGAFDFYLGGRTNRLSEAAVRGFAVFRRADCTSCHDGPALGGRQVAGCRKVASLRGLARRHVFLFDGSATDLPTALKRMPVAELGPSEQFDLAAFLKEL